LKFLVIWVNLAKALQEPFHANACVRHSSHDEYKSR
jgi:hypothetical protein